MSHRAFVLWEINPAIFRAVFSRRNNAHVQTGCDFRKQQAVRIKPSESGGIGEKQARLSTERRYCERSPACRPGLEGGIGEA